VAIVCDTSPLSYLILIGEVDILADLYGHVSIPSAVAEELRHPDGPDATRRWINAPPGWLHVLPSSPQAPSDTISADN
jgi:predicted nucleic acid-binding protein